MNRKQANETMDRIVAYYVAKSNLKVNRPLFSMDSVDVVLNIFPLKDRIFISYEPHYTFYRDLFKPQIIDTFLSVHFSKPIYHDQRVEDYLYQNQIPHHLAWI